MDSYLEVLCLGHGLRDEGLVELHDATQVKAQRHGREGRGARHEQTRVVRQLQDHGTRAVRVLDLEELAYLSRVSCCSGAAVGRCMR